MRMRHPKIERAIAERRAEYAAASQVTKKRVIDGFLESIEMAKIKADPLTMIAGWREVGKMCGFYEPTKAKSRFRCGERKLVQRLNAMSDEELLKLAEGDPNVLEGEVTVIEEIKQNVLSRSLIRLRPSCLRTGFRPSPPPALHQVHAPPVQRRLGA